MDNCIENTRLVSLMDGLKMEETGKMVNHRDHCSLTSISSIQMYKSLDIKMEMFILKKKVVCCYIAQNGWTWISLSSFVLL